MSRTYTPDKWVMLKITSVAHGTIYKVLASWYGGFAGSNSWKLSSGTKGAFLDDEDTKLVHFPQDSGSAYICHKEAYGMSGYTNGILSAWLEDLKSSTSTIEVMPENFSLDLEWLK